MSESSHVLYIELGADYAPDVVAQLSPHLSTLVHRKVTSASSLSAVLREKKWDAIVGGNNPATTDALHLFFANLPGMACQIRMDADNTLHLPYVSEGSFALLGITPLELELHPELLFGALHPEDNDAFYKGMQASATQSTTWNWEGRIVLPPAGEIKWVNLRATRRETGSHGTVWEGFMVNITQNKLAEQEIITSRRRLRELSSHIDEIKEKERMRIAREIHDEIGVLLTALKIDLVWLTQRLPQGDGSLHEKTRTMSNLLDMASSSANNLVHSLRPGFLDYFGIVAAIEIEAKEFTKRTGIPASIVKSDENIELSSEHSLTLFRVFQEMLNNIMKHSMAKQVQIEIYQTEKSVRLVASDDGKGFDEISRNKPRSFGLRGIQERIGHLGGTVKITSALGKGTQIAVCLPLDNEKRACKNAESEQVSA